MEKRLKKAFTISRHAELVSASHAGFTLAEVLITLMIIGVVAAITIPILMSNVNERALANQRKTVAAKIAEGFAQMRVAGDLETSYADTAAFVKAMQKYFKINQVCKQGELSNCFVASVTAANGEETQNVSDVDDGSVIGLVLSDGTSMIIKYNPEGTKIAEGQVEKVTYQKDENGNIKFAEYGDLFQYDFDVNTAKGPNTFGKDIVGNLNISRAEDSGVDAETRAFLDAYNTPCTAPYDEGTCHNGMEGFCKCSSSTENDVWVYFNDGYVWLDSTHCNPSGNDNKYCIALGYDKHCDDGVPERFLCK